MEDRDNGSIDRFQKIPTQCNNTMQIGVYYATGMFVQENTQERKYTNHKTRIHR